MRRATPPFHTCALWVVNIIIIIIIVIVIVIVIIIIIIMIVIMIQVMIMIFNYLALMAAVAAAAAAFFSYIFMSHSHWYQAGSLAGIAEHWQGCLRDACEVCRQWRCGRIRGRDGGVASRLDSHD